MSESEQIDGSHSLEMMARYKIHKGRREEGMRTSSFGINGLEIEGG